MGNNQPSSTSFPTVIHESSTNCSYLLEFLGVLSNMKRTRLVPGLQTHRHFLVLETICLLSEKTHSCEDVVTNPSSFLIFRSLWEEVSVCVKQFLLHRQRDVAETWQTGFCELGGDIDGRLGGEEALCLPLTLMAGVSRRLAGVTLRAPLGCTGTGVG